MFNSSRRKENELLTRSYTLNHGFQHTREKMIDLADQHIQAVQTWLSTRTPNAKRFLGKGVVANCSGLPVPLLNLAFGTDYDTDISDELIENEIESVKTFYKYQSVPWSWWVGPNPTPTDMIQRLKRHDLTCNFRRPVMVARLPFYRHSYKSDIQVYHATTIDDLEMASTIRRRSFGFPEGVAETYFESMSEDWLSRKRGTLYLAGLRGEAPSAIGALIEGAELPGVYMMGTLPKRRRYGLGSAILTHILTDASQQGYPFIMLTASPLGYPLYSKFGFVHLFDYLGFGQPNNSLKQPLERRDRMDTDYIGSDRRSTIRVNEYDLPTYTLNQF